MDSVQAQKLAEGARARGWAVTAHFGELGWGLECRTEGGQGYRHAWSRQELQSLIGGGVVARLDEVSRIVPRRPGEVSDETLRDAVELLESLGDHVGNVDPRTMIDRCRVLLNLREALREREQES